MKYSGFFEEEQIYVPGYTRFEFISYKWKIQYVNKSTNER